ncbi:dTMP kinase [Parathalassolituus penaei]|uniref:Thymidylate kinase n=1 Tax=Parathalassolituus penaei TaxID=2997323 RepID=A0A9X3EDS8_9GAMM|nr:dTMP kinase [Parathalassolituus penaei]MCY0965355.1 dTMP kinase [Parathalassolituus penaei]
MSKHYSGRFITFEGGEGAGKSTNIQFCADWLSARGQEVLLTREPGGTPIAELIRSRLLKANHSESMDPLAELLLMFAARAQHVNRVIRPALQSGCWVLCDRFTDSTIAYQGFGRGLDLEQIATLKNMTHGDLAPDRTFLLDTPVEVGMARARGRGAALGEETDRFEREQLAFFERVREGFQALAATNPHFVTIDATQSLDLVQSRLQSELERLLAS